MVAALAATWVYPAEVMAGAQVMISDVIAQIREQSRPAIVRPAMPGLPGGPPLRSN